MRINSPPARLTTPTQVIVKFPSGSDDQMVSVMGKTYMFDKVMKPNATQSQVYDATAKNIVRGKSGFLKRKS